MKNILPVVLAASVLSLAGCSKSKDNTPAQTNNSQDVTFPAAQNQPAATGQAMPAAQGGATAGLNPAHGQPGHRCDIQVGAPLNSAPATAPSTTVTPSAAPSALPPAPVLPSAPPISTAKGLNPPHGQPGHDCGIAVGAPLKN
ncbi:hypothetical protein ACD591_19275 [Rufibacter glacialis]|uniref:Uncharacterized protein n=1 Tax=Rufibacter glacialis TaxID=1259555 RepID=A0A5M8Q6L9_9BACT|nr:hypothetical protein [Rufibacter glacialis]KAA6430262.1 hypothetical protein FOE74_20835 [Rufibacter glacialis]